METKSFCEIETLKPREAVQKGEKVNNNGKLIREQQMMVSKRRRCSETVEDEGSRSHATGRKRKKLKHSLGDLDWGSSTLGGEEDRRGDSTVEEQIVIAPPLPPP